MVCGEEAVSSGSFQFVCSSISLPLRIFDVLSLRAQQLKQMLDITAQLNSSQDQQSKPVLNKHSSSQRNIYLPHIARENIIHPNEHSLLETSLHYNTNTNHISTFQTKQTANMRSSTSALVSAAALISSASARIHGFSAPATIVPNQHFEVQLLTQNYIQVSCPLPLLASRK